MKKCNIDLYCSRCRGKVEIEDELIENNKLYIWVYCPNKSCEERRLIVKRVGEGGEKSGKE